MKAVILLAVYLGRGLAKEECQDQACPALTDEGERVAGEVLLQKSNKKVSGSMVSEISFDDNPSQVSLAGRTQPSELSFSHGEELSSSHGEELSSSRGEELSSLSGEELSSSRGEELSSSRCSMTTGYQGAPACVTNEMSDTQHHNQVLLATKLSFAQLRGGADASLDADGFKEITSLCCPYEMEIFFGRLLDSLGFDECSHPHVQGLMHWFSCVPDMDFDYMTRIIYNGNPCKYWAPKGETCLALSGQCAGHWCAGPTEEPVEGPKPGPKGSISGSIFDDENGDGDPEADDDGIAGITVTLVDKDGKKVATTLTGPDGDYKFDGLPGGEYTVQVSNVPKGMSGTYEPDNSFDGTVVVSLTDNQQRTDVDFGFQPEAPATTPKPVAATTLAPKKGAIMGLIFEDNAPTKFGLAGVTVQLINPEGKVKATRVTGADGKYKFDKLPAGVYTIKVTGAPDGYSQTFEYDGSKDGSASVPVSGVAVSGIDFGFHKPKPTPPPVEGDGSIAGFIFKDENGDGSWNSDPGLTGVTLSLLDKSGNVIATQVSGTGGTYKFDKLPAGEYSVKVTDSPEFWTQTYDPDGSLDANFDVTLGAGEDRKDAVFGFEPGSGPPPAEKGSIAGSIFDDKNGDGNSAGDGGIAEVTVQLMLDGKVVNSRTTTASGNYKFDGLAAGQYTVVIATPLNQQGWSHTFEADTTRDGKIAVNLAAGQDRLKIDFGYQKPTTTTTTLAPPTTTTTVTKIIEPVPTTTPPTAGCKGSPKDIFLVIDASKSVKSAGWEAERFFAWRLVQEITADGNPNKHQINLQWFNADTTPIGASGGANSVGRFGTDAKSMSDALEGTAYESIRAGSTDHPQVYMTADAAFKDSSSGAVPGNKKVLLMITDGETHKGNGCGKLDQSAVEAKIGKCTKNGHVCGPRGCDMEKCMCGVYNAQLFKEKGHELIIVGIANQNHIGETEAGIFNEIMKDSASPGRSYIATNFEDLVNLVVPLVESLCQ